MKTLVKVPLVLPYAVVVLAQAENAGEVDSMFSQLKDAVSLATFWSFRYGKPFLIVGKDGAIALYRGGRPVEFSKEWFDDLLEVKWMVSKF